MITKEQLISFLNKSLAYLEAAYVLSLQEENELYNTAEYNDVINHLVYHSTELFLKFGILMNRPNNDLEKVLKNFDHSLPGLYKKYRKKYSDDMFAIDIIFDKEAIAKTLEKEDLELYNEYKKKYDSSIDIISRYPFSKSGIYHQDKYGYTLQSDLLKQRKESFRDIASKIMNKK